MTMLASLMASPVLILNCGSSSLKAALVGDAARRLLELAIDDIGGRPRLEVGGEGRAVEVADAGAAAAIHQAVVDLATRGSAVLVISQDLDELLELCDSLAVINLGRLSKPIKVSEVSIEEIGLLMGGVHGDPSGTQAMTEHLHAHPA